MCGDINTIVDTTTNINNIISNGIVNYITSNVINKYLTITTNPIIYSIVIHIINNLNITIFNSNTYDNDNIIITL